MYFNMDICTDPLLQKANGGDRLETYATVPTGNCRKDVSVLDHQKGNHWRGSQLNLLVSQVHRRCLQEGNRRSGEEQRRLSSTLFLLPQFLQFFTNSCPESVFLHNFRFFNV